LVYKPHYFHWKSLRKHLKTKNMTKTPDFIFNIFIIYDTINFSFYAFFQEISYSKPEK